MTSVGTGSVSTGIEGVVSCTGEENRDTDVGTDSTGTVAGGDASTGTVVAGVSPVCSAWWRAALRRSRSFWAVPWLRGPRGGLGGYEGAMKGGEKRESGWPRRMLKPMSTCPWEVVRCSEEVPPMRHTVMNSPREAVRKFMVVHEVILRDYWWKRSLGRLGWGFHPHRPG